MRLREWFIAGALAAVLTTSGLAQAQTGVLRISVKVPGRLRTISVDLGSVVRQGDVVAILDLADFRLRVEQAATALAQARARLGVPLPLTSVAHQLCMATSAAGHGDEDLSAVITTLEYLAGLRS